MGNLQEAASRRIARHVGNSKAETERGEIESAALPIGNPCQRIKWNGDEILKTLLQGLGLPGYMDEIREPLRLTDVASHPSSVGFPANRPSMKALLR